MKPFLVSMLFLLPLAGFAQLCDLQDAQKQMTADMHMRITAGEKKQRPISNITYTLGGRTQRQGSSDVGPVVGSFHFMQLIDGKNIEFNNIYIFDGKTCKQLDFLGGNMS